VKEAGSARAREPPALPRLGACPQFSNDFPVCLGRASANPQAASPSRTPTSRDDEGFHRAAKTTSSPAVTPVQSSRSQTIRPRPAAVRGRSRERPPHRSRRALLTHRALALDGDLEALGGPGMLDAGERDPADQPTASRRIRAQSSRHRWLRRESAGAMRSGACSANTEVCSARSAALQRTPAASFRSARSPPRPSSRAPSSASSTATSSFGAPTITPNLTAATHPIAGQLRAWPGVPWHRQGTPQRAHCELRPLQGAHRGNALRVEVVVRRWTREVVHATRRMAWLRMGPAP
jgi:hypothetical protein